MTLGEEWKHAYCFGTGEAIPKESVLVHVEGVSFYYEVPGRREDWVYPHEGSN